MNTTYKEFKFAANLVKSTLFVLAIVLSVSGCFWDAANGFACLLGIGLIGVALIAIEILEKEKPL